MAGLDDRFFCQKKIKIKIIVRLHIMKDSAAVICERFRRTRLF
jgi:hypothetical protein